MTKIDIIAANKMIERAGMAAEIKCYQRPRSVKFMKRYPNTDSYHGISRTEARMAISSRVPYAEVAAVI